jgi:hypothetical protein
MKLLTIRVRLVLVAIPKQIARSEMVNKTVNQGLSNESAIMTQQGDSGRCVIKRLIEINQSALSIEQDESCA